MIMLKWDIAVFRPLQHIIYKADIIVML